MILKLIVGLLVVIAFLLFFFLIALMVAGWMAPEADWEKLDQTRMYDGAMPPRES
jgi:hypothetical protein